MLDTRAGDIVNWILLMCISAGTALCVDISNGMDAFALKIFGLILQLGIIMVAEFSLLSRVKTFHSFGLVVCFKQKTNYNQAWARADTEVIIVNKTRLSISNAFVFVLFAPSAIIYH